MLSKSLQFFLVIILISFVTTLMAGNRWDKFKEALKEAAEDVVSVQNDESKEEPTSQTDQHSAEQPTTQNLTIPIDPILITIDGVDSKLLPFAKEYGGGIFAEGRGSSYLGEYVDDWDMVTKKDLHYVAWTGDITDTDEMVVRTKDHIERIYKLAHSRNQPIIIVAHSWGGVLASRALAELREENRIPKEAVDLLVTIGTPVRNKDLLVGGGEPISKAVMIGASGAVKKWQNYHNEDDWISSVFSYADVVSTVEVSSNYEDAHESYFKDPIVWNQIEKDSEAYIGEQSRPLESSQSDVIQPPIPSNDSPVTPANPTSTQHSTLSPINSVPFNEAHLRNLHSGLQANAGLVSCNGCQLGAVGMSGIDLSMVDFGNATLTCSDFSNTDFSQSTQRVKVGKHETRKARTSFDGANLSHANFSGSNLQGIKLKGNMLGANFEQANLQEASLRGNLDGAIFREANLKGAKLDRSTLFGAVFYGADLSEASLKGAILTADELAGAKLCNTIMPTGSVEYSGCSGMSTVNPEMLQNTVDRLSQWQGFETVESSFEACGSKSYSGLKITSIIYGGPAWSAGLAVGDHILSVHRSIENQLESCKTSRSTRALEQCRGRVMRQGNQPICGTPRSSQTALKDVEPEETVSVNLQRAGQRYTTRLTVGVPNMQEAARAKCPPLIADLPEFQRGSLAVTTTAGSFLGATFVKAENPKGYGRPGMIVTAVEPGSVFYNGGLRVGDFYYEREDARIGTIDTGEELRALVERDFKDDPNRRSYSIHFVRKSAGISIDLVAAGYK